MIGLDTNILVRHLTQDHPGQSPKASAALGACTVDAPGFVNRVVLCELVWVLTRAYRYHRGQVGDVIETLLTTADILIEDEGAAWSALARHRDGHDFADAMIGLSNAAAGAQTTLTFDRKAAALPGFSVLE